jgi:UDP-N-acetylmuramate dehydrogenase
MTDLARLIETGAVVTGVPLGALTTYRTGGPASYFAEVADPEALQDLLSSGMGSRYPILVLGRGSNVVVSDKGFSGLVIRLGSGFNRIDFQGTRVTAGAALPLPRLARASSEQGLAGLEFFVGIPGSVGGAVRQNAGCFGSETKDRLLHAEIVDLRTGDSESKGPDDLEMVYRRSNLAPHQLVIEATFQGEEGDPAASLERLRVITRWRRDNQPGGTLNAGSVFKNPPGVAAGALIDSLGLKGLSVGEVSVAEKHANFFVASPGASADDIHRLAHLVKDRVFELSGTMLEFEVQFVGFES